jgi:hypothetical protein
VVVSRSASTAGQSLSWAVVIAWFLCSSDFGGLSKNHAMTFIQSATTRRPSRFGPARTPLCWTQPSRSLIADCHSRLSTDGW